MIKNSPTDGFLRWLHCLFLMDDTIILATSRDRLKEKVEILLQCCHESGMVINQGKTKSMVISGNKEDRAPLLFHGLKIDNCEEYLYLGAIFTQDGKITPSVNAHIRNKKANMMKFSAFL